MNVKKALCALVVAFAMCGSVPLAKGQSISMTIESLGGASSGTGTSEASTSLGAVSKFDVAPSGFALSRTATDWTLSSSVGVRVDSSLGSPSYSLTAQLGAAPSSGVTWKVDGMSLSDASPTTLTNTGAYGSIGSYEWDIVIDDSAAGAVIDNSIVFTAVSN